MTNNIYVEYGDYGRTTYTVKESNKGYIIEVFSKNSDEFNGSKMLIRFSEKFPKGLDLNSKGSELIIMRHDLGINLRKRKINVEHLFQNI